MKAHELTESGYYWFTPSDDSPEPVRNRWTGGGTELVTVLAGQPPFKPLFSYVLGPGHSTYHALLCGGEFVGPLRPQAA